MRRIMETKLEIEVRDRKRRRKKDSRQNRSKANTEFAAHLHQKGQEIVSCGSRPTIFSTLMLSSTGARDMNVFLT